MVCGSGAWVVVAGRLTRSVNADAPQSWRRALCLIVSAAAFFSEA